MENSRMAIVSLVIGGLLIAVGVAGYMPGMSEGTPHITALIPAFVGIALQLCGILTLLKPALTKHVMHAAAMIGVLGFLGGVGRIVSMLMKGDGIVLDIKLYSLIAMSVLCAIFVFMCVNSFIQVRKARQAAAKATPTV